MKNLYLTGAIILFIVCITVFAENVQMGYTISFLGSVKSFVGVFPLLLIVVGGLGSLVTLYIQAMFKEREMKSHTNFDL